jgi:metallo-beta-lactamase class B
MRRLSLFLLCVLSSYLLLAQTNKTLQQELLQMEKQDQKYRLEQMQLMGQMSGPNKVKNEARLKYITAQQENLDKKLLAELETIVQQHGWPTISLVGKEANQAAFLILQHADASYQKKYVPLLKEAAVRNEANPADVAMMEDRILMNEGKEQLYGTQLKLNDKTQKWMIHQIEDESNVDARRASVGLPPMAEYLRYFEENFGSVQRQLAEDVFIEKMADGVWRHITFGEYKNKPVPSNGLIVKAGREVLLIDTAWNDKQTKLILDWIEKEWQTQPKFTVITHFHGDRLGGIREVHRRGIKTISLQLTATLARQNQLEAPQQTFTKSLAVALGKEKTQLLFLGAGHSPDNIVVWLPRQKVLHGGCLIKDAQAQDLGNVNDADLQEWPKTMHKALQQFGNANIVVPGHGEPSGIEAIKRTLELLKERNGF